MWPIINMPEKDQATDTGDMHQKFGKDRACGSEDIFTDRQTDIVITLLCNRFNRRSKNKAHKKYTKHKMSDGPQKLIQAQNNSSKSRDKKTHRNQKLTNSHL